MRKFFINGPIIGPFIKMIFASEKQGLKSLALGYLYCIFDLYIFKS